MSYDQALKRILEYDKGLIANEYIQETEDGNDRCYCALTVACPKVREFFEVPANSNNWVLIGTSLDQLLNEVGDENFLENSGMSLGEAEKLQFFNDTFNGTPEERKAFIVNWLKAEMAWKLERD